MTSWGPPRASIDAECARRGRDTVVDGCRALLRGEEVDHALVVALGGPAASAYAPGLPPRDDVYWLRVWAARGLLWAYLPAALPELRSATRDEHWRVREMALKTVARHGVDELLDDALRLRDDEVARVRAAASRAVAALTTAWHPARRRPSGSPRDGSRTALDRQDARGGGGRRDSARRRASAPGDPG